MRSMKTAVTCVALLLLAGCSGAPAPGTKASTSQTPTVNVADVAFLAEVRPQIQGSSDAILVKLGHDACAAMGSKPMLDVASDLVDKGFSTGASAAIATKAVSSYCPQYKDQLSQ